jgi:tetratricopeptide (TPR) repeat protein
MDCATNIERATHEKRASPEVFVSLAELYERGPRAREAAALVEQASAVEAHHSLSLLAQARLKRLAGALEEAERLTRDLLQQPSCEPQTRFRAWYELGGNLDRQGRFDEAMSALLEAKRCNGLSRHDRGDPSTAFLLSDGQQSVVRW